MASNHKINVVFIRENEKEKFELYASSLKEILSLLELQKGSEFVKTILNEEYKYVLYDSKNPENSIALTSEVIFTDYSGFDTLLIIKDISGEDPFTIGAFILTALVDMGIASAIVLPAWAVTAIGMVALGGIMMGLNMIMQALTPTPEFSSDPAAAQNKSNLFNGAPIVRDQGGIMPLVFGNPYCGAVLISSGMTSEDLAIKK